MNKTKIFTGFLLKLIAIFSMLIDHIGYTFFPKIVFFRLIGRIAFPLFAFFIAEGFFYTSNRKKYLLRLSLFAIISEIPFDLVFFNKVYNPYNNNVLFTFTLAIILLWIIDRMQSSINLANNHIIKNLLSTGFIMIFLIIAEYTRVDYGATGIAMVLIFYAYRDNNKFKFILISFINIFLAFISVSNSGLSFYHLIQAFAVLSIPFILLYNGKRGANLKYIFYAFYPTHLLVLYLIRII